MSSTGEDHDALLARLNAFGDDFLASFNIARSQLEINSVNASSSSTVSDNSEAGDADEWNGFANSDSDEGSEDSVTDDEFVVGSSTQPEIVYFDEPRGPRVAPVQSLSKSFMSSKVSKLRDLGNMKRAPSAEEVAEKQEEMSNIRNDALLHRLVHTKLLSNPSSASIVPGAQKKKALAGRLMELADKSSLGRGESRTRLAEHKKASKRVRQGLLDKRGARRGKELEEAKNRGVYHRSLKRLYEDPDEERPRERKRERGMRLGAGRFEGGVLKLKRSDIASLRAGDVRSRSGITGRKGKKL